MKLIVTPYDTAETINWVVKYITGPSRKNAGLVKYIPQSHILNESVKHEYTIAAVGDIMSMRGRKLVIGGNVREFIRDSDWLVGNFEGTITTAGKSGGIALDQRIEGVIADPLATLFPPEKTYLSVSNNHAGDFGKEEFFKSVRTLESRFFKVFGFKEKPYIDVCEGLRIISGTMWTNRPCDYISDLDGAEGCVRPGAFNLLYPHFGFEYELYPRPETVSLGRRLLDRFDAIIGHHSHCPQPVTSEHISGVNRLLAYSLGDFCFGVRKKADQYGIIVKARIGHSADGGLITGKVEWRFTRCRPFSGGKFIVDLEDRFPYLVEPV